MLPTPPAWFVTTAGATLSWALSDVCCDVCIKQQQTLTVVIPNPQESCSYPKYNQSAEPKQLKMKGGDTKLKTAKTTTGRLTSEQNAFVSGIVSMMFGLFVALYSGLNIFADLVVMDKSVILALLGGSCHFLAYFVTLGAFQSTSSTVITPLLQLSALWMLPLSSLSALLGSSEFIHPVHFFAVLLIVIGGFLPAAKGNVAVFFTSQFWKQRCVMYCILGEFLICLYNLLLHQSTYGDAEEPALSPLSFFVYSRLGNSLTCFLLFYSVPRLNKTAKDLLDVRMKFALICFLGEFLSTIGVLMVTFGYCQVYEPSLVNAAEGGLQQLFNLILALAAERYMPTGVSSRRVENLLTKVCSFVMVSLGLLLSQWEMYSV